MSRRSLQPLRNKDTTVVISAVGQTSGGESGRSVLAVQSNFRFFPQTPKFLYSRFTYNLSGADFRASQHLYELTMSSDTNSKVSNSDLAQLWIKPNQFSQLQEAAYQSASHVHLQDRDHAIVTFLYDSGFRVGEAVAYDREMLRMDEGVYYVPSHVQKQYPTDGSPDPARLSIDPNGTTGAMASLRRYLNKRTDEHDGLFVSQKNTRLTEQGIRNVVRKLAERAKIQPYTVDGSRANPDGLRPHHIRHSVAYRILAQERARLIDARNRLRHTSISTTERIYEHFRVA